MAELTTVPTIFHSVQFLCSTNLTEQTGRETSECGSNLVIRSHPTMADTR